MRVRLPGPEALAIPDVGGSGGRPVDTLFALIAFISGLAVRAVGGQTCAISRIGPLACPGIFYSDDVPQRSAAAAPESDFENKPLGWRNASGELFLPPQHTPTETWRGRPGKSRGRVPPPGEISFGTFALACDECCFAGNVQAVWAAMCDHRFNAPRSEASAGGAARSVEQQGAAESAAQPGAAAAEAQEPTTAATGSAAQQGAVEGEAQEPTIGVAGRTEEPSREQRSSELDGKHFKDLAATFRDLDPGAQAGLDRFRDMLLEKSGTLIEA